MLHTLPLEILYMVAELLPWYTIRSMSQVSTGLYTTLVPRLYESIRFRTGSEWALNDLDIDLFFRRHGGLRTAQFLHHTKRIARFNRCVYYKTPRLPTVSHGYSILGSPHEPTAHEDFIADLSAQLGRVFALLNPDTLHLFCWYLGTCMPTGILDDNGYLIHHQKNLHRVSLITDGTCPHAGQSFRGLTELTSLADIAWEGIRHRWEIDVLRICLQRNQTHLRKLQIGFLLCGTDCLTVPELTQPWLGLPNEPYAPRPFLLLTSLSLSNVRFPGEVLNSAPTLSFQSLQELRLLRCDNQLRFLWLLAQTDNPPPLKRLEVNSDLLHESDDRLVYMAIVELLLSLHGLQHLHIKLTNFPRLLPGLREAILRHQSSLRSFSFHERQLIAVDEGGFFEDVRDVSPRWTRDIPQVIQHCALTAVGLCLTPLIAHNLFVHVAEHSSIQLLHIRFSGEERVHRNLRREIMFELHKKGVQSHCARRHNREASTLYRIFSAFAWTAADQRYVRSGPVNIEAREFVAFSQWAFGATGLPALQVLALGDFSH
ncbi:hypothetical protein FE257_001457 [Aspergillus nanangensis]|uniref:F-box domain-containing protein n=1 Tax=Aspergillus nanangensis TaxID=2582783 RepID=A0AAD4CE32_ASPNN|nr:hypothetical protein FE257_001457 [Aspergillus nanangensis]